MKFLDKLDIKVSLIIFLLSVIYGMYSYYTNNYEQILITKEGEFVLRNGHLIQLTPIDLYKGAE